MSANLPLLKPNIDHIVTEDDTPVDNLYSERQQRLLVEPLYASWNSPRPFVAMANVGLFYGVKTPPIVPDTLLSMDVELPQDIQAKEHRSYFTWEYAKPPEVTFEVVSNQEGEEFGQKKTIYAQIGVDYYIVWDMENLLKKGRLTVFELGERKRYRTTQATWFPDIGLGVTIWNGEFEGMTCDWLRWCDEWGHVIPTGQERAQQENQRAEQEKQRAEQEKQRAEQQKQRAEQEKQRADRLAEQLRKLSVEPQQ